MTKVFSFCLYGSNPKYNVGMIENIKIINKMFNDWFIYIYYNNVPIDDLEKMQELQNVVLIKSKYDNANTTLDRFIPIDDPNVEIMFVRDADSRIHDRDIWAIKQFIESDNKFHIIRDHIWHGTLILAGLWGIKRGLLNFNIGESINNFVINKKSEWGVDQHYLRQYIYPIIKHDVLIHGMLKMTPDEIIVSFPHPVKDYDFCGQVIDYKNNKPIKMFNLSGFMQ